MASLYELFGSEKSLEDGGAWIPVKEVKFSDGTSPEFKVKRIGGTNCPFNREVEKLLAPHRKRMRQLRKDEDDLSQEIKNWASKEAFIKTALVDWRNVPKNFKADNEKGDVLIFDTDNAKNLMNDRPELCAYLIFEAIEKKHYQDEDRDEDSKNL